MKKVAFISQKGGVGKSSIAVHLAVVAWQANLPVVLLDCDPQQSATAWSRARAAPNPPVATCRVSGLENALTAAENDNIEFAVIDSAPRLDATAAVVAHLADLVVVPIQPGPFDIAALPETMDLLRASERRAVILLSRCPTRSLDIASAHTAIESLGLELAPVQLGDRTAFRRALADGKAVTETDPNGLAAAEIKQFYAWLKAQLWATSPNSFARTRQNLHPSRKKPRNPKTTELLSDSD